MTADRLQLAVIIGSVRAGRIAPAVSDWFAAQLDQHDGFSPNVIDLAGLSLPDFLDGTGDAAAFAKWVDAADGFVIITPEYNHGYPGALKTAIDTAREEWQAKPVGFVSYGGIAGGLRAVEQLRLVFAELHAVTIRQVVSLHWVHDLFDGSGMLTDDHAPAAAHKMLAQLAWWARALRNARAEEIYDAWD
jgi:NAD(P)H-dependent FMN reductase